MGKPLIASRDTNIALLEEWPDFREAVEFLETPGDTRAFADAIARILALAPDAITERSETLRRVADRYRWENLIEEYLDVIEERQS